MNRERICKRSRELQACMIPSRAVLVLACLISITAAASANSRVEQFAVSYRGNEETRPIAIREHPGQRTENEGYILESTLQTPTYRFVEPIPASEHPQQFAVSFVGSAGTAVIEILGDEGAVVGMREVSRGGPETEQRSVAVQIPTGTAVIGFRVTESPWDVATPTPLRIVGAELGQVRAGVHAPVSAVDSLVVFPLAVGPETQVVAWGTKLGRDSSDGQTPSATEWSMIIEDGNLWPPDSPLEISYRYSPSAGREFAPWESGEFPSATVALGDRVFEIRARPGRHSVYVYPATDPSSLHTIDLQSEEDGFSVESIRPVTPAAGDSEQPLPADLATLIDYPWGRWRHPEYEIFSWNLYPEVLIVDTSSYEVQARFFKRLAFFAEKIGFRGEILTDSQLAGRHGYNAHNYSAEGLAAFYNAGGLAGISLHTEEELLRSLALHHSIIVEQDGRFVAGSGGILGVSRESDTVPGLRRLLLSHEAYHGVYYADPGYVAAVSSIWNGLSDDEQYFWRIYLSGLQYDVSDPYLLENEYHAYLLQQPIEEVRWLYTVRGAQRLRAWYPNSVAWIDGFVAEYGGSFVGQAVALNKALFTATGLIGGDVSCLVAIGP